MNDKINTKKPEEMNQNHIPTSAQTPDFSKSRDISTQQNRDIKNDGSRLGLRTRSNDMVNLYRRQVYEFCLHRAKSVKREQPITQLALYALALSRLTGLRLYDFKCAWFDENAYFEFFPLHVVYKLRDKAKKDDPKQMKFDTLIDPDVEESK